MDTQQAPADWLILPDYLIKASPVEEGGDRYLYMEASNEHVDLQGERVLAKSLEASADYFMRNGNVDIDHRSLFPPRDSNDNPRAWEIGYPVEVQVDNDRTLVKAVLFKGDTKQSQHADFVWDSLTKQSPPARWFPSVGGQILERGRMVDPLTKAQIQVVKRVRWSNIALSRTPVNVSVPPVSTIPVEVFAKCCMDTGCLNLTKALEAGYGTDSAALTDGAALRQQSLDSHLQAVLPANADDWREQLAGWAREDPDPRRLTHRLVREFDWPLDQAERQVERFLRALRKHLDRRAHARANGERTARVPVARSI